MKWPDVELGELLDQDSSVIRIDDPANEKFMTIRLYGLGVTERRIGAGKTPKPSPGYRVRAGQFVYSRIDARNGAYGIVPEGLDGAVCSKDFPVFDHRKDRVCLTYLLHMVCSEGFRRRVQDLSFGATNRQRVKEEEFLRLTIPLPPLPEQRRIAAILDHADALRAKRREAIAHLDELALAAFQDTFGDLSSYEIANLSELAQVSSGLTKGRRLSGDATTRSVPYLAVVNVQDRRFELSKPKFIHATEQEIERYQLQRGDLLLTEGGDPDKLGRGSVWHDELPEAIHQNHIFKVRSTTPNISPIFLNWVISSVYGRSYFLRSAKQTTGIASINSTQLKAFPVPVPARNQQERFERHLALIAGARNSALASASALDSLFSSLQSRAFRGEL